MTRLAAFKGALGQALAMGDDATAVSRVCRTLADALPGEAAAVTMMMSDVQRQTVFAGDDVIQAFENAQYTIGEGPSLLAFNEGRPVLIPAVDDALTRARWPGLTAEIAALPVASVFCFPMSFGVINVGVCAFYRRTEGRLTPREVSLTLDALDLTTLVLLQLRGDDHTESLLGRWLAVDGHNRRKVHQATGMLMGQLGVSAETAFARLRGRAYSAGTDIEEVADDIVNRRLVLEPDP